MQLFISQFKFFNTWKWITLNYHHHYGCIQFIQKNPELIHILEENHVTCFDESYENVFIEYIKCHHNDFANYVTDNLLVNNEIKESFDSSILSLWFHYHNFGFFPSEYDNKYIFYYACQYDYLTLEKLLFTNQEYNLNEKIVSIIIF